MTESLRAALLKTGRFTVLDQESMIRRLVEAKVEQSIFPRNADQLATLGLALNVPYILAGKVEADGLQYDLSLYLVDVTTKTERIAISQSRLCSNSDLPLLAQDIVSKLLATIDRDRTRPTPTEATSATIMLTLTPTPTPTPTSTPMTAWYKKWSTWAWGALALGSAIIYDQTRPESHSSTSTPTPTATITTTPTPTWTLTPTPTPTFGCNPNGYEAYVSYLQGQMQFYMNCYESQNVFGVKPTSDVTWYKAASLCEEQGNDRRLCTQSEWRAACTGNEGYNYPYGYEYDPYACYTEQDLNEGPFDSGTKPKCVSPYGVFDMSGNVSEWSGTEVPDNPGKHYKLGGDWTVKDEFGCYESKEWDNNVPTRWTGFRCCRDIDHKASDSGARTAEKKQRKTEPYKFEPYKSRPDKETLRVPVKEQSIVTD
ncbi:SUMF1/EgtB/PvdO family nonheme iron enzyme [bacterium]|nr:SUMF1/EgtB/PvdO family nonheme iron enzyme [bacterium]